MDPQTKNMVLIVDDAKENIDILFQALVGDYELGVAVDGETALEYVTSDPPDLILLDVMMPGMDGFEVCRRLKKDPLTKDIPIIFLTAMTELENKTTGFEAGAVDYVTKPFEILEVKARVKTHLDLRNALKTISQYNKKLEDMVEIRTKELIRTERQAAFSLLIQGIVHNLRNPLNGILGSARMIHRIKNNLQDLSQNLAQDLKDQSLTITQKLSTFTELIEQACLQLDGMINSMMAKSRTDKSDKFEQVDLNEIIRQELTFLDADLIFKHKTKKDIALCDTPIMVNIVPSEITQVFQNLVRNALHAMWEQPDKKIMIKSGVSAPYTWFSIADNGPGIDKKMIPSIFDPFFSTKPKTGTAQKNEPEGTGLGLYSCLEIIKTYHGKIDVNSKPGQGTTFTISIISD